jgi:hypothetical protein
MDRQWMAKQTASASPKTLRTLRVAGLHPLRPWLFECTSVSSSSFQSRRSWPGLIWIIRASSELTELSNRNKKMKVIRRVNEAIDPEVQLFVIAIDLAMKSLDGKKIHANHESPSIKRAFSV